MPKACLGDVPPVPPAVTAATRSMLVTEPHGDVVQGHPFPGSQSGLSPSLRQPSSGRALLLEVAQGTGDALGEPKCIQGQGPKRYSRFQSLYWGWSPEHRARTPSQCCWV